MKVTRAPICEAVYERMTEIGLDPESEFFEDVLMAVVGFVMDTTKWYTDSSVLAMAVRIRWTKIRAKYPEGEAREHAPFEEEIFIEWKKALLDQIGDVLSLTELLEDLEEVAQEEKEWLESPEEDLCEDGVSVGEGAGTGAESADGPEPAGDAGSTGDRAADRGCAGTETGAVEAECLDYGEEDEETETDRILRALALGSESERRDDVGVPREGSGEALDETGGMERRKACFGSLPPMSKYRSTYRSQVLRR